MRLIAPSILSTVSIGDYLGLNPRHTPLRTAALEFFQAYSVLLPEKLNISIPLYQEVHCVPRDSPGMCLCACTHNPKAVFLEV